MLASGTTRVASALQEPMGSCQPSMWLPGSWGCKNSSVMTYPAVYMGPQVIHDWLTWGPNFKTLCNHLLPFLCHPSLKAGEISLAMNVWNSLPASGVTGPHGVYNKHWMKVCPVSWRFQEQREDELEMLMKPHFSVLSTRNHRHILAGSCVTWLLESQIVVQGPAVSSSPGSLLEMKTLSPPTSGWITTCTFTRSPEDPHAH